MMQKERLGELRLFPSNLRIAVHKCGPLMGAHLTFPDDDVGCFAVGTAELPGLLLDIEQQLESHLQDLEARQAPATETVRRALETLRRWLYSGREQSIVSRGRGQKKNDRLGSGPAERGRHPCYQRAI